MAEIKKSKQELENIFRKAIHMILTIPDTDNKTVRFGYGTSAKTGSSPGFSRTLNTIVVYDLPYDDTMNAQKDISFQNGIAGTSTQVDEHIDVHQVLFVCYGPNAFENARSIRDGMSIESVRSYLKSNAVHYIPKIAAPVPVPEIFNGEWWDRYDVKITFNEKIRLEHEDAVPVFENVELKTLSADVKENKKRKDDK